MLRYELGITRCGYRHVNQCREWPARYKKLGPTTAKIARPGADLGKYLTGRVIKNACARRPLRELERAR